MSLTLNMVGGGGGGLKTTDAILRVIAPALSTVTITKGSVSKSDAGHENALDHTLYDYYFIIHASQFDANPWTITAVNGVGISSTTIVINVADEYDVQLHPYVPNDYQLVEYIEKNSNAYIDTGVILGSSDFEINYKIITPNSVSSSTEEPITSIWASTPNYWHNQISSSSMKWYLAQQITIASSLTGNTEYAVQLKRSGGDWTYNVNGTTGTAKSSYNPTANNTTLKILVRGDLDQKANGVGMKMVYYDVSVSGTVQRKMYPCYRKSDSAVGLYDVANSAFYGSDGTGVFTAGADVI